MNNIIQVKNECFNEPYCEIGNICKQLQEKEQECERLNNELHKNFKEKNTLHFIIDRLLEASGYDTNTASAEDFEDVYEHMRYDKQQLDQLKDELSQEKNQHNILKKMFADIDKANVGLHNKLNQLKAENEELKKCYKNNSALLDFEETNTTKLVNKVMKLEQILAEIKEHFDEECKLCKAKYVNITDEICEECETKYMLQKISEVEDD